jgi:hypothetical protein
MRGILWKTLGSPSAPWEARKELTEVLARWAEAEGVQPVECAVGVLTETWLGGPSREWVERAISQGATAVWLPVITSVRSLVKVGSPGGLAGLAGYRPPMTAARARALGGISLLDGARLRPTVCDTLRLVADHDVALFFGHASPDEALALAEEVERIGFRKAVVDHPFSQIVDLNVAQLCAIARAGVYINWTYDELSPLLGVDPQDMVGAILAVGPEQCVLSSDAGDPVMPHSVEALRLLRVLVESYGIPRDAVERMSVDNPAHLMGLSRRSAQRGAA